MKKLAKFSAIVALFLFSGLAANAQIKVGVNGGVQIPTGDLGDGAKTGFGGGLSGKYMLNPNMGVGLNLGYYSYGGKEVTAAAEGSEGVTSTSVDNASSKTDISIIPITANYTYYFGEGSLKPYVGVDLGAAIMKMKNDAYGIDSSSTKFMFAPVVGVEYGLTESLALELNVKYNFIVNGIETQSIDMNVDPITSEYSESVSTSKKMATSLGINLGLVYSFGGK